MPDEDRNSGGSLDLDFKTWRRHMKMIDQLQSFLSFVIIILFVQGVKLFLAEYIPEIKWKE